jgi:hypothetical protein
MQYYKYLSPERIDVLENLKIRFTQVSALNDPFESLLGIINKDKNWYFRKFVEEIKKELTDLQIRGESKRKQYFRKRKREFPHWYKHYSDEKRLAEKSEEIQTMCASVKGILSFSATNRNVLMWSHYAKNHEGFVIGFNGEHNFFGKSVHKVICSETRPYYDPTISKHSPDLFDTKSIDWEYEQEYRKTMSLVGQIKLENGNNFSPYDDSCKPNSDKDKIFLFDVPKESISCVILGWKSDVSLNEKISKALENHELENVLLQKARPHKHKFEMEIE